MPLDFEPPYSSSLSVFRGRLVEHGQERDAFNRLIQVGRAAGFLPDKITVLVDSMAQHGAGAVQDTYTLIRKGIRRVVDGFDHLREALNVAAEQRGQEALEAHRRVRAAARMTGVRYAVRPQLLSDMLGIYMLLPVVK